MTTREAVSVVLALLGVVVLAAGAFVVGGLGWGLLTSGGLMVAGGVLLGIGESAPAAPVDDELTDDLGPLR